MARLKSRPGSYPHVKWVDLQDNGTLTEVAVVKQDAENNTYFFELNKLDSIDRQRFFNIITKRHAGNFQLWDLLNQHTLGNGINALDYFHQLVKILTPSGTVIDPKAGVAGVQQVMAPPPAAVPPVATPPATSEKPE